ncbi:MULTISPECIES: type VI secretion system baseplate subunit TssF [unclassified Pseudoalteromonas]|uniref:type VI secretion system baseplate subunit TssF n=1 Tax=unclassified Pseudoalteromonas TaxID=194690 RepID=UPI0015FD819C|nr:MULTISPECIES: type VI secretion system baseplate subunit TssF [unclassified Pseudoalteromonas]MBB1279088.1 type VI secretion system baseplate subunit TssF [Pseudoalteromonas sp. SR41-1]MBB1352454.1 type VI secretion system baseplate subunit TssF [Pseudoalteromonas sp. SR45-5]
MQQYFDAQMRLLTQAGKQFAQFYPEHAGMLNIDALKDRDPHIERLLEGVAYLTAHTQKRLDESVPEVSEQVLRQLCPILLSYYPSSTVVQFKPKLAMQKTHSISKGLQLNPPKAKADNKKIIFSTTHGLDVVPLDVEHVRYQESHLGAELRIGLKFICQGERSNFDLSKLNFYLRGDTPLCSALFQLLKTPNKQAELDFGANHFEFNKKLKAKGCSATYLDIDGALLPSAAKSHPGYALLLDYFNAKDRFYFLTFDGLKDEEFPEHIDRFEIVFRGDNKLPPGHQLSKENILINCVPAVNLFSQAAEPIKIEPNRTDYMISADQARYDHVFSYTVDAVAGRNSITGQSYDYTPRYQSVFEDEKKLFTVLTKDVGAAAPTHYLQLPFNLEDEKETLSVDLTSFNAGWPRQLLQEGDLNEGGKDMPSIVEVKNVIRPTNYLACPSQPKHWQLISLLNVKFSQITQVTELKRLLVLFDWSNKAENRLRIESILKITATPISQIKRGIFIKGVDVLIDIDESKFVGDADLFHFCNVLHEFFLMYAPINESVQTRVNAIPSYKSWSWDIEPGKSYQL